MGFLIHVWSIFRKYILQHDKYKSVFAAYDTSILTGAQAVINNVTELIIFSVNHLTGMHLLAPTIWSSKDPRQGTLQTKQDHSINATYTKFSKIVWTSYLPLETNRLLVRGFPCYSIIIVQGTSFSSMGTPCFLFFTRRCLLHFADNTTTFVSICDRYIIC